MTPQERDRYLVRDGDEIVMKLSSRRAAIDHARACARKQGRDYELEDSQALPGAVSLWSVRPSGLIQAIELRTVEQAS